MRESIEYSMTNASGDDGYTDEEDIVIDMDHIEVMIIPKKKRGKKIKRKNNSRKNFMKLGFIINDDVKMQNIYIFVDIELMLNVY